MGMVFLRCHRGRAVRRICGGPNHLDTGAEGKGVMVNYSSQHHLVNCPKCGVMVIVPVVGVEVLCPNCGASVGVGA